MSVFGGCDISLPFLECISLSPPGALFLYSFPTIFRAPAVKGRLRVCGARQVWQGESKVTLYFTHDSVNPKVFLKINYQLS